MQPLLYSEKEAAAGWRRTGDNICYYANHHGSKKKGCQPFFTLTFRSHPHTSLWLNLIVLILGWNLNMPKIDVTLHTATLIHSAGFSTI